MARNTKKKLAIFAGTSKCLIYAEAKYCASEMPGEIKYYEKKWKERRKEREGQEEEKKEDEEKKRKIKMKYRKCVKVKIYNYIFSYIF